VLPEIVYVLQREKYYATALKYATKLLLILQNDPDPTNTMNDLAKTYFDIGYIHSCKHDNHKAILNYRTALKYMENTNAESSSSSLNKIFLGLIYNDLGSLYAEKSNFTMSIKYYQRAIKHQLKDDESNTSKGLALTYISLGQIYLKNDDTTNALIQFMKALEIGENSLEFDDETIRLVLPNLVQVLQIQKDYATALEYALRILSIQEKDPTTTKNDLATTYFDIGSIHYCNHNNKQAILNYRTALKYASSTNTNLGQLYYGLALTYDDLKNHKEALVNYNNALKFFSNSVDFLASSYNNIGAIYCLQCNYDEATYNYHIALEISETNIGLASATLYNIAVIDHIKKDYMSALETYQMILNIMEEHETENEDLLIKIYNNMGGIYNLVSNYEEQLNCYQKVLNLELNSNKKSENDETIATTHSNLGIIYFRQCNYSAAVQSFEKALDIASKLMTSDHPDIAEYHNYISLTNNHLQFKGTEKCLNLCSILSSRNLSSNINHFHHQCYRLFHQL
jgi:tetratricopeptide (TPR) repeat protein